MSKQKQKQRKFLETCFDHYFAKKEKRIPRCIHYEKCGGCSLQNIKYEDQLDAKLHAFRKLIAHDHADCLFDKVRIDMIPSPHEYQYRQKMSFVFANNRAGLREKGTNRFVTELSECPIARSRSIQAFLRAKTLAREFNLQPYSYRKQEGYLRYFVSRETRAGEVLLSLLTFSTDHSQEIESIAKTILSEKSADSVYWQVQPSLSDVSFGKPVMYWGKPYIYETILDLTFHICPDTFFQANTDIAEIAFQKIIDWGEYPDYALDLYCGTSVIGILLSEYAGFVDGVESMPENIELAHKNLNHNAINNVRIYKDTVERFLKFYDGTPEYIVLNPPRIGIGEETAEKICLLNARKLAYLSCNPLTLLDDIKILSKRYAVHECYVFDMFPNTKHFETLVLLAAKLF